jgi:hypothetical protein
MELSKKYRSQGHLSDTEWLEICALDYVLTWNYTDNYQRDLIRYKFLSNKRWG